MQVSVEMVETKNDEKWKIMKSYIYYHNEKEYIQVVRTFPKNGWVQIYKDDYSNGIVEGEEKKQRPKKRWLDEVREALKNLNLGFRKHLYI